MSLSTISAVNGQTRQARTGRACGGTGRRAGVRPGTAARAREMPVGDRQTATAAVLLPVEQHQARRVVAGARLQRTLVSRAPVGRGDVTKDRVLVADAALVYNTSNTPEERELQVFGDPLERIWRDRVFDFCGIKNYYRKMFRVVASSTFDERRQWLEEVEGTISCYFPEDG